MQKDKPAPGKNLWDSIKGNYGAKRALEIAAAGGHGVLLVGAPESPKAMLAKAMIDILPPLSEKENLEVQRIHAVNGNFTENGRRPFEQASGSTSLRALLGGGIGTRPGRVSLAHRGVLYIDNAGILPKSTLEALRAPLEDKAVTISRLREKDTYPADFIPVLGTLPCPCGHYGEGETCTCTPGQRVAYLARLSGPVFDRLAVQAWTQNAKNPETLPDGESAQAVAERVAKARRVQIERQGKLNEELTMQDLDPYFCADAVKDFLGDLMCKLDLSMRAYYRILCIARTIADLEGAEDITTAHIAEAASYRFLDRRTADNNENHETTCNDHSPPILDPCCGSRMMYFDKGNPLVLFCDNRELHTRLCDGRRLDVEPEVRCDFRELPFPDGTFRHVAFDPPHLLSGGDSSWIIKKYGRLPRDRWKEYLRRGFQECWRVLADQGTLVFKWSEEDIPLKEVLPLFPDEPVYGNLARNNRQIFLVFFKGNHNNSEVGHPAWDNSMHKDAQRPLVICAPDIREGAGSKEDLLMHKHALWKTVSPGGTLVLQWNHPVSPKETERLFPDAVYGNRSRGDRQTFLVFYKPSN